MSISWGLKDTLHGSDFSDHMENAFARSNILVRATGLIESNIWFSAKGHQLKKHGGCYYLNFWRHNVHNQSYYLNSERQRHNDNYKVAWTFNGEKWVFSKHTYNKDIVT